MRNGLIWMLAILLLPLVGCSTEQNQGENLVLSARGGYLASQTIAMSCELTADYGERVYDFEFDSVTEGAKTTLTLTEPAELTGLVATVETKSGESSLSYEGVLVETGELSDDGLTPITAVPAIVEGLKSGYIQSVWQGETELVLTCGDPDTPVGTGQEMALTLDSTSGNLLRGEIFVDGFRVIDCEITEITWGGLATLE